MNNSKLKIQNLTLIQLALIDAVLLTAACLIPAASHLTQVRLFLFNPMVALLLTGILLGRDWRNALVLAVMMPLVSNLLTGMPASPVCMIAQLATMAAVFGWLQRKWAVLPAVLVAIVASIAVYYALKVLTTGILFSPNSLTLNAASLLWGLLFALLYKRTR